MKNPLLLLAFMAMMVFGGINFSSVVAMHDSTLDVNTWIASDNSTQLQTTDLNRGPVNPAVSAGAAPVEDTTGPSTVTPTTPDGADETLIARPKMKAMMKKSLLMMMKMTNE
jgi:hypothetical protein